MKKFLIRYSEEFAAHLEDYLTALTEKSPRVANKRHDDIPKTGITDTGSNKPEFPLNYLL